jgi:hypothetical protein
MALIAILQQPRMWQHKKSASRMTPNALLKALSSLASSVTARSTLSSAARPLVDADRTTEQPMSGDASHISNQDCLILVAQLMQQQDVVPPRLPALRSNNDDK